MGTRVGEPVRSEALGALPFTHELLRALWVERRGTAADVRLLRQRRLAALVRHARVTTRLFAERLAHVDPDAPINLAQIQPITKSELMARLEDTIEHGRLSRATIEAHAADRGSVDAALGGRYVVATTSGTTGEVGYFVQDRDAFERWNGALFARVLRHRLVPREVLRFTFGRRYRMAMAIATGGHFITRLVAGYRPLWSRPFLDLRTFSILEAPESNLLGLNLFRPHYLHGYSTFVEALAHERIAGRLAIDPEFVSLGSEPVTRRARETIAQAFPRAQIVETYGATECLAIANQCPAGRLHVNEDLVILEPVDAQGRPVPVGVASDKVYLTNLLSRAQPLLRYELQDSVTILGDACPCGSPMTSIRVEGRSDDTFALLDADGRSTLHPPIVFEALILGVPGLERFQLVHVRQNVLEARVVAQAGAEPAVVAERARETLRRYLADRGLAEGVEVHATPVDAIPREARGHKLRQIYSQVPRLGRSS
jgi:phenylacetate-CoA ligase